MTASLRTSVEIKTNKAKNTFFGTEITQQTCSLDVIAILLEVFEIKKISQEFQSII